MLISDYAACALSFRLWWSLHYLIQSWIIRVGKCLQDHLVQPFTSMPTKPHHWMPHAMSCHFLGHLQQCWLHDFLGQPVQMLDSSFLWGNYCWWPTWISPAAWGHFLSSCLWLLAEETNHLSMTSFQAVVEWDKVSPEPPFPSRLLLKPVLQALPGSVVLLWTHCSISKSSLDWGAQSWTQDLR